MMPWLTVVYLKDQITPQGGSFKKLKCDCLLGTKKKNLQNKIVGVLYSVSTITNVHP